MSREIDLKEAERKVFRSAFQDGLVEIGLGCWVLMFAIGPFLSPYLGDFWSSAVFVPFWALAFGLLWLIRRRVVRPRVGVVEFGAWRKTRLLRFNVAMLVAGIVVFVLGTLSTLRFDAVPGWMHIARFWLIVLVGFSAAAFFLDYAGLYLYGALLALAPLIGEALWVYWGVAHHGYPITFGLATAFLILTGLAKLARLLHTYPAPGEGARLEAPING